MKDKIGVFVIGQGFIKDLSKATEYAGIERYFPQDEWIAISPLLITCLLKFTKKENLTDLHAGFFKRVAVLKGSGCRVEYILEQQIRDNEKLPKEEVFAAFGKLYNSNHKINKDAVRVFGKEEPGKKYTIHNNCLFTNIFLLWFLTGHQAKDNAARKEITREYLKAIKERAKVDNNAREIRELGAAMMNIWPEDRDVLSHLLSTEEYSPYKSINEFFEEIKNIIKPPLFGKLDPYLKPITPLHICMVQTIGSLGIGALCGQNRMVLAGVTLINSIACVSLAKVAARSDNFAKCGAYTLRQDFKYLAALSAGNSLASLIAGSRIAFASNIPLLAAMACKVIHEGVTNRSDYSFVGI